MQFRQFLNIFLKFYIWYYPALIDSFTASRIQCFNSCHSHAYIFITYNQGQKLHGQLRKMALSLTPQAMNKQFKRPYAGSVREHYNIYRKT